MTRNGLLVALALAAAAGLLFGLWPQLDLAVSALFFDPERGSFPVRAHPFLEPVRNLAEWILILLVAPAVVALAAKFMLPRRAMFLSGRAALFLIVTLALGPGLLVNAILKENWSRPRPVAVTEFGGAQQFVPWWDPRGACRRNCSFVSGEGSSAFWTVAPALLVPPPWKALALTAAAAYAAVLGGLRVAAGAHFASDALFAALFTFLIIWLVHAWLYRRTAAANGRDPVERGIERLVLPLHAAIAGAWKRLARRAPGG